MGQVCGMCKTKEINEETKNELNQDDLGEQVVHSKGNQQLQVKAVKGRNDGSSKVNANQNLNGAQGGGGDLDTEGKINGMKSLGEGIGDQFVPQYEDYGGNTMGKNMLKESMVISRKDNEMVLEASHVIRKNENEEGKTQYEVEYPEQKNGLKSSFIGSFYTTQQDQKVLATGIKKGVYQYGNGTKYEGEFNQQGQKHGYGVYHGKKFRYEGMWANGKKDGNGIQYHAIDEKTGEKSMKIQKSGTWVSGKYQMSVKNLPVVEDVQLEKAEEVQVEKVEPEKVEAEKVEAVDEEQVKVVDIEQVEINIPEQTEVKIPDQVEDNVEAKKE